MHVEHFMTRNPVACDFDAPVRDVAQLMADKGVGCVVVLQNGKVSGLVTDRQLAVSCVAQGLGPGTPVHEVMTASPATLTLDDNIFSAIDTMRSAGVARRVPVVNAEKELLGIVSISDIGIIAKDLMDYILMENIHHAMSEARILTGAKRMVDVIRRPTKTERLVQQQEIRPVTAATAPGAGPHGGTTRPTSEERGLLRREEADLPGARAGGAGSRSPAEVEAARRAGREAEVREGVGRREAGEGEGQAKGGWLDRIMGRR